MMMVTFCSMDVASWTKRWTRKTYGACLTAAIVVIQAVAAPGIPASAAVAGSAAATGRPPSFAIRGLDISSFQHAGGKQVNWRTLARYGIRFAGIKVSEGTYYANPYYRSDARAAAAAGLYVMPYVFANPRWSGGAATAAFAIGVSGYRRGARMLPLAVDLENDPYSARGKSGDCYGLRRPAMLAWIAAFTHEITLRTGVRPVIYTTADWWRQCTGNTRRFQRSGLWVADYGVRTPAVPAPWQHWTFWQYTDGGRLPGVGVTDLDYIRPEYLAVLEHLNSRGDPRRHRPAGPGRRPGRPMKPKKTRRRAPSGEGARRRVHEGKVRGR